MTMRSLAAVLVVAIAATLAAAEVEISQTPDKAYHIKARTYQAVVDRQGNWKSLVIDGVEFFGDEPRKGAAFPDQQPPESINLSGTMLAIRSDKVRVEYRFDETGVTAESEGANLRIQLSKAVTALVDLKGKVHDPDARFAYKIEKIVAGKAAVRLDPPLSSRFRCLLKHGRGATDKRVTRIECGVSSDPDELVMLKSVSPGSRACKTVPFYKRGEVPSVTVNVRNLGTTPQTLTIVYALSDHVRGGKTLLNDALPEVTLAPGKSSAPEVKIPVKAPGCYWVNIEIRKGDDVLRRGQAAFVYDADSYKPALTRPADFREFWDKKLETMRAVPMDAKLTKVPERSTSKATHYDLALTLPDGKQGRVDLQVPCGDGPFTAVFANKVLPKATDTTRIHIAYPHKRWPDEARFRQWTNAADNNLLECYLIAVRIADYLRSRDDVEQILLRGASRQGPIQLVNAALDSTKIAAVDAHVPTSFGISWEGYRYRGWGTVPAPPSMAAYVDPVNFARDLRVPFIMDVGTFDKLVSVPGALAFYNAAVHAPWKRLSIEPGGHGYFPSDFRKTTAAELESKINVKADATFDDDILKEH